MALDLRDATTNYPNYLIARTAQEADPTNQAKGQELGRQIALCMQEIGRDPRSLRQLPPAP